MNKKSKLGIAATILLTTIYASGLISSLIMVGLIIATLLIEEDEDIKEAARKAFMIFMIVAIVEGCFDALTSLIRLFSTYSSGIYDVASKIDSVVSVGRMGVYLVFAFMSLSGATLQKKVQPMYGQMPMQGYVPNPMQNPMQNQMGQPNMGQPMGQPAPAPAPAPAPNMGQPAMLSKEGARKCPQCGSPVADESTFCTNCGCKM